MGRGSRILIFVIYWECISFGAGKGLGESYNLLGICVGWGWGEVQSSFTNF